MARRRGIKFSFLADRARRRGLQVNDMTKQNGSRLTDRELGMDRTIPRRVFLNGAAMTIGAAMLPATVQASDLKTNEPQNHPGYNPPTSNGLRGSHPGSFEIAHNLRDGTFWQNASVPERLPEKYDLVIVGGGISGLAAAHFYRERQGAGAKILILENHDDFGGHAKRNEFHLGGKLQLLNGGTMLIDSPTAYSTAAAGLMKKLGVDAVALERKIRDQPARTLATGGFDPARDIEAITVNRWPHGYGYEYNPLFDPEWPEGQAPHLVGRKRFGRITIANSDSGATAYTDVAIDQAYRAVSELLAL
jgi:NAD(P)-binding Rossmann-like domain